MEVMLEGTLQYPHLWTPRQNPQHPEAKPTYGATLIMDGQWAAYTHQLMQQVSSEAFSHPNAPHVLHNSATERPGKEAAGFTPGTGFLNATRPGDRTPPMVCTTERVVTGVADPDARKFQPGARVRMLIDIYGNKRRQKVFCELKGVQFVAEGPLLESGGGRDAGAEDFGLPKTPGFDPATAPMGTTPATGWGTHQAQQPAPPAASQPPQAPAPAPAPGGWGAPPAPAQPPQAQPYGHPPQPQLQQPQLQQWSAPPAPAYGAPPPIPGAAAAAGHPPGAVPPAPPALPSYR